MLVAYLGPGVGIGGLIVILGILATALFVVYAFIVLPLASAWRRRRRNNEME